MLCDRWRFFILLRRIWLPRIELPRILPRIGIQRTRVRSDKNWLPRSCNAKARALTERHALHRVAILFVHRADVIGREVNAVRDIFRT